VNSLTDLSLPDREAGGRLHPERPEPLPHGFELDRYRIIHCTAFRRLEHKTQVFVTHEGDHYRTRLTHTLEVASLARRLAVDLGLNGVLAECIALAHDLGHPPFGHAGESALARRMTGHGGFEHNLQSLRVIDYLEHPYPTFRGLNLTFAVREGLAKHHTKYDHPPLAAADAALQALYDVGPSAGLESQVANLADEIAYSLHDIEDGLLHELIDENALRASRLWCTACEGWRVREDATPLAAVRRPILDRILDLLLRDAAAQTRTAARQAGVRSAADVRRLPHDLAGFSESMRRQLTELQAVLKRTVYQHVEVQRMDEEARRCVAGLFEAYAADPARLPERFVARIDGLGLHRVICDYIAGMTDRFCRAEFERSSGK